MLQHSIPTKSLPGAGQQPLPGTARPRPAPAVPSLRGRLQVLAAVKRVVEKHVACSKTLVAMEGQEDKVQALCAQVADYVKDRATDASSGILTYTWSRDGGDPRLFHFWEVYNSNVALGRLNTSKEVMDFMQSVQDHLEEPIGMALFEMKDGKLGPAAMQGGPKGEGGLDDATGASGAAGGASYKQTSAAVDLTNVKEEDDEERGLWGIKFELPWLKKKTGD